MLTNLREFSSGDGRVEGREETGAFKGERKGDQNQSAHSCEDSVEVLRFRGRIEMI